MALSGHGPRPTENHLLFALPVVDLDRLSQTLQSVTLSLGQVVYEYSERLEYIYFPTSAVVSLLYTTQDGSTAEMGLVGNDGAVGVALFLGGETTPNRGVVQIAGAAHRMPASVLRQEFGRGAHFNEY